MDKWGMGAMIVLFLAGCATTGTGTDRDMVFFQAHRGGLREMPENTMAAYEHAWALGGIPEVDIQTTKDGVIVCLHDETLARTTDAPEDIRDQPVSAVTYDALRQLDAGSWFGEAYAGQRVPALQDVFAAMQGRPERQAYLDLKDADLEELAQLIARYGVAMQIIFCHNKQESCIALRELAAHVRTMLWIGGSPEAIKAGFERAARSNFEGLDQVQLHLAAKGGEDGPVVYAIEPDYLRYALAKTARAGVDLEVLPFRIDDASAAGDPAPVDSAPLCVYYEHEMHKDRNRQGPRKGCGLPAATQGGEAHGA